MKILMVLTSHDQLGNTGRKTGFWLEEFAAPYFVFRDAGVDLTLASPKGGQPRSIQRVICQKITPLRWLALSRMRPRKNLEKGRLSARLNFSNCAGRNADNACSSAILVRVNIEHLGIHRVYLLARMIPRRVEFSETELPKSSTGKIFKRILRERFWAHQERAAVEEY